MSVLRFVDLCMTYSDSIFTDTDRERLRDRERVRDRDREGGRERERERTERERGWGKDSEILQCVHSYSNNLCWDNPIC